jgi:hypothetical protein
MSEEIKRYKRMDDDYKSLAARLEAAEAIIVKLPTTADGVPVVPGMEVWTTRRFSERKMRPPFMVKVSHVWNPSGSADIGEADVFGNVTTKLLASFCYSTREAAEQAKAASGDE